MSFNFNTLFLCTSHYTLHSYDENRKFCWTVLGVLKSEALVQWDIYDYCAYISFTVYKGLSITVLKWIQALFCPHFEEVQSNIPSLLFGYLELSLLNVVYCKLKQEKTVYYDHILKESTSILGFAFTMTKHHWVASSLGTSTCSLPSTVISYVSSPKHWDSFSSQAKLAQRLDLSFKKFQLQKYQFAAILMHIFEFLIIAIYFYVSSIVEYEEPTLVTGVLACLDLEDKVLFNGKCNRHICLGPRS